MHEIFEAPAVYLGASETPQVVAQKIFLDDLHVLFIGMDAIFYVTLSKKNTPEEKIKPFLKCVGYTEKTVSLYCSHSFKASCFIIDDLVLLYILVMYAP